MAKLWRLLLALEGPPVNCWTIARKFAASVLSKVVGVRLEALDLFRTGLATRVPSGFRPDDEAGGVLAEETAVVTTVESETTSELLFELR